MALGGAALAGPLRAAPRGADPDCRLRPRALSPRRRDAFAGLHSGMKITGMKVFGVSLTRNSDRPYVFVKLETNQGMVGWGEGTLEGKAGAVMACVDDFRDFLVGADPMQVEHIWQSMYVHSFYRAGPVMGSAISGIDQALWDIRGKGARHAGVQAARRPLRRARRARLLSHQWRAHAGRTRRSCARPPSSRASRASRPGIPGYYEWIDTNAKIERAVATRSRPCAKASAPISTSPSTSTPRPAPTVASDHGEGSGAAEPAVHRGAVPAGEREGDGARSRGAPPRPSPPASGWSPPTAAAS